MRPYLCWTLEQSQLLSVWMQMLTLLFREDSELFTSYQINEIFKGIYKGKVEQTQNALMEWIPARSRVNKERRTVIVIGNRDAALWWGICLSAGRSPSFCAVLAYFIFAIRRDLYIVDLRN